MSRFLALAAALGLAACSAAPPAKADAEAESKAIVGRPAETAVARDPAAERCRGLQLIASIDAYTPPRSGHVELVFALVTDKGVQPLGRTAIFPQAAFAAERGDPPQSFGFRVDRPGLGAGQPRLRLTLEAVTGQGADAAAALGQARLAAVPEGGC